MSEPKPPKAAGKPRRRSPAPRGGASSPEKVIRAVHGVAVAATAAYRLIKPMVHKVLAKRKAKPKPNG